MSDTEDAFGVTKEDEGEQCTLRYQSVHHPDAEKTAVEAEIDEVYPDDGYVFLRDEQGRLLEVTPRSVVVNTDGDGDYVDRRLGTDPELEVKRLHRVHVDGTVVKYVRASDENTAREIATEHTDFGELSDATDADAATRVDEVNAAGAVEHRVIEE